MHLLKNRSSQWVIANILGIGGYIFFSSKFWVSPAEFGTPGGPGDAFAWLFSVAPFLLFFSVLNLVVLFVLGFRIFRGRHPKVLLVWAGVIALWVFAIVFNYHMSYNVISSVYA